MRRVKIRGLAGVHHRPTADRDVTVEHSFRGEARRGLERRGGGLDRYFVVHHRLDVGGTKRCDDRDDMNGAAQIPVGEQRDALHAVFQRLLTGLGQASAAARIRSEAFSAIMTAGTLVLPETSVGMTLQSTTRSPDIPCTLSSLSTTAIGSRPMSPILHVPLGWKIVPPVFFANSSRSSSLRAIGPGRYSDFT